MFTGAGVLISGAAQADNFVDRGNPDNALSGQCIDGTNPLCVATKSGSYVAVSTTNVTMGTNARAGTSGIAIGDQSNASSKGGNSSGGAIAIGIGSQALANSATAIGTVALAQGNTSLAVGRQSAAVGDFSMALGNVADAHGTSSIALGHSALASGDRSVAIGGANPTTSDGVSSGAAYDAASQTRAAGSQSVAIGAGAQTSDNNQVAIGSGSVGANNGGTPVFGGTAAPVGGAVSFGSLGKERQLKNVAAGAADTDAVNVQQLKNVNGTLSTSIANVDARVTSVGNSLSTSISNVDQRVTNVGSSLSTSIVSATKNVVKYTDDSHAAIALDGSNGTTIGGVAAGVANTDAVNVGQLKGTVAPLQTSISTAASNIANLQTSVTGINTSLSTATTNIGNLQAADARNVKYDGQSGFDSVTFAGTKGTTLHNVAAGAADTDAVNVGQLKGTVAPLQTSISTAASNITNLQTSVTGINTSLSTATTNIGNLQAADARNVKYDGQSGFDSVTFAGPNGTTLHNVAAGVANTDAVNVGQLNGGLASLSTSVTNNLSTTLGDLNTSISNQIGNATKNAVQYDDDAHSGVTLGGKGAQAPVALHNVADGVAAGDAVNVGQLGKATDTLNQSITNVGNNVTALGNQVTTIGNQVTTNTGNIAALQQDALQWNANLGTYDASHGGNGPQRIGNVAAGVANTDAVNVGQLNDSVAPLQTSISTAASNITNLQTSVTGINTSLSTATTNIGNLQAADARNVKYDGQSGFDSVTFAGPNGTTLHNVAAGVANTDAVNVGQLNGGLASLSTSVTNNISTTIGDLSTSISNQIGSATKNAVQYDDDAHSGVTLGGKGAQAPVALHNVADGVAAGDAVNVGQLGKATDTLNQSITNVGNNVTALGNQVTTIGNQVTTNTGNITSLQQNALQWNANLGTYDASHGGNGPQRIGNVADGVAAGDAVNVGQLGKATDTLNQSITNVGNNVTALGNQVTTIGNQVTTNTGNIAALQQDALQWNANLGTYDASHGGNGPQRIGNVAAGKNGTDAVNVDQLNAAVQDGTSQLDALAVKYDDASKRQVSLGAGNGGTAVRLTNIAEGTVAAGSTDAVNGAQLRRAADGTAAALGGGATANPDGSIGAPDYKVGGGSYNNVGDALTNLDGRVGSNTTTLANHETRITNAETNIAGNTVAITGLQQNALQFDPTVGAYNAARDGAPTKLTNVADGNVAAGSTDAVNGGQLSGVQSSLEQQITQVSNQAGEAVKNVVKYDVDTNGNRLNSVSLVGGDANAAVVLKNVAAGTDDTDAVNVKQLKGVQANLNQLGALAVQYDDSSKSTITLGGGAGGTRITNVQAGTLSATSTDAVNGSQLYATNQQVSKNTTDITNLQGSVTNIANGKAGLVQQQDPNGAITVGSTTGGTSVSFTGTAGDRVLTGVAAGVNDNDAVNMGQFNSALKNAAANDQIRTAATDANTTWIARADSGSIGTTASATGKNSVAVGPGSVADRDNSFSVGAKGSERQVTNVAAGSAPTDAVNVQQLNDNISAASSQANGYTDQRIGQVYNSFNDLKKDMYGGVASAMAVAGLPQPTGAGRSMVSAATSNYHGQQGFAAGYSYVTESNRWVVKASVTGNTRSDFGAVVGAGYQF
nr:YadA-like family protein [Burkholderia paludis]